MLTAQWTKPEAWKVIEGYPDYQVSTLGRVWSDKSNRFLKCLTSMNLGSGTARYRVKLYTCGLYKNKFVHQLVGQAFIRGETTERNQVNHKDGDGTNNNWNNLEWVSPAENKMHAVSTLGRGVRPVVGVNIETGNSIQYASAAVASKFGFDQSHIIKCCRGKIKQHKKHQWKYANEK